MKGTAVVERALGTTSADAEPATDRNGEQVSLRRVNATANALSDAATCNTDSRQNRQRRYLDADPGPQQKQPKTSCNR